MSERRLEVRRPVPARSTPVEQLSAVELQRELERRITNLEAEREKLVTRLATIETELGQLGAPRQGTTGRRDGRAGGGDHRPHDGNKRSTRKLPKNEHPLVEVLHGVVTSRSGLTTREAAEAAVSSGYKTTSQQFVNICNTTMSKDERFVREDGKWGLT